METTVIKHEMIIQATPIEVYEVLMSADRHAELVDSEAEIEDVVGSPFSIYGGYIRGVNLELVKGQKIVQTWQASETDWPQDHWSEIVFLLDPIDEGTMITFYHHGVPLAVSESIAKGWVDYYWNPLQQMFSGD